MSDYLILCFLHLLSSLQNMPIELNILVKQRHRNVNSSMLINTVHMTVFTCSLPSVPKEHTLKSCIQPVTVLLWNTIFLETFPQNYLKFPCTVVSSVLNSYFILKYYLQNFHILLLFLGNIIFYTESWKYLSISFFKAVSVFQGSWKLKKWCKFSLCVKNHHHTLKAAWKGLVP